jgi:membrane fusion protein (multidrug efflux system)
VLAPQQGISRDAKGNATALVIDKANKVVERAVKTVQAVGGSWVVSEGLKPGEHLIVQGTDKAMPGATVKPVLVKIGADPMGISRFFIDRPIFAWVVAISIMLAGIGRS